jgi:hypothetical protein
MPGIRHQAVVQVLRDEPQLLVMLLGRLGVSLPSGAVPDLKDSNLSSRDPDYLKELIADNVFLFRGISRQIAVVFEVQASRPKQDRKLAWPAYLTIARAIHKCDTVLCVIGLSADAVRDSAQLIRTGHPDFDLRPKVTGHGLLPPPGGATFGPGLTVLKVMTRELDLSTHEGRMFTLASIATAPDQQRELYARYIRAVVPPPVRKELTNLMSTVIKDPFMDRLIAKGEAIGVARGEAIGIARGEAIGIARGEAIGKAVEAARMLLRYLDSRFDVPEERRQQVEDCADASLIETWFDRALTATTLDQVFAI